MQNYQKTLSLFDEATQKSLLFSTFFQTDLGKLYQALPISELAAQIPSPRYEQSCLGRKPWFTVEGGIGLMILKNYLGLSDRMLISGLIRIGPFSSFAVLT